MQYVLPSGSFLQSPAHSTAPTYIFSTPFPTVSKDASITVDQVEDVMEMPGSLELSMSMNFAVGDEEMSLFFEDFEQFDVEFESMSMVNDNTVDDATNVEAADEPIDIIKDTTTEATAATAVETESSTSIVLDEIDIIPLVSETDSTEITSVTTTPAVATKPFVNRDCTENVCAVELSPELLMEYQVIVPETSSGTECDGCALQVKMTYDGIGWIGLGFSNDGGMIGSEAVM